MFIRHAFPILLSMLFLAIPGMGGESAPDAGGEAAAAELLSLLAHWEPEKIRELGRRLNELPEAVAAEALWMAAAAPARVDASQLYAAALSSPFPAIRRQAMDILAASDSEDDMRLLTGVLAGGADPETVSDVVAAIARKPERRAVPALVAVILAPKAPPGVCSEAADHLRRLTRTNISDSPTAWGDWWLDHGRSYE